jgi:hypothetical protein
VLGSSGKKLSSSPKAETNAAGDSLVVGLVQVLAVAVDITCADTF